MPALHLWLGIALIAAVAGVILGSRHAGHGPPVAGEPQADRQPADSRRSAIADWLMRLRSTSTPTTVPG